MKRSACLGIAASFMLCLVFVLDCSAQTPPSSETAGGISAQQRSLDKEKRLEKRIEKERPQAEEGLTDEMLADTGPKVLVKTIRVEGPSLLSPEEILGIIHPHEGKELSLKGMQKVADLITDAYRRKGYATSRAYLPPQTIKDGILLIKVVEGKLGEVQIRGNKYFKTSLYEKKLDLQPGGYFDYSALQRSLVYINEAPDRKAKVTLVPGKAPGTTDVVIDVEDQMPIHAGFEYDNYASRYLEKNRFALVLEDNNLFGFDDKLYLKALTGEASRLRQYQGRYSFPVFEGFDLGGYFLISRTRLGEEFSDLAAKGKASLYGLFSSLALVHSDPWDLRLTAGFDYKDIKNYLIGSRTSTDRVRVAKLGLDSDSIDSWGRTIVSAEVDQGIPDIFDGMDDKDSAASRAGGGGKFTKMPAYLFRLQTLPWEMSFLWKNIGQFSNHALVASEQFQIGGPISVRGYPPAEYSGDKGLYSSPEVSIPIYFLPRDWKVPYNEEKWYDTSRLVVFYDWAEAHYNRVEPGTEKHQTLRGWGFGYRFNLRDNITCRVEVGYPLGGKMPTDGDHAHPWVEFTAKF